MNIEQLEKGKELRSQIDELNQTQKQLIENYKTFSEKYSPNHGNSNIDGVSVSFRMRENNRVVCVPLDKMEKADVFNMLNNCLMRKITALETEFEHL